MTLVFCPLVRRACVVLGIVFALSSLCILGKAIHNLATRMHPEVVKHTRTHTTTHTYVHTHAPSMVGFFLFFLIERCYDSADVRRSFFARLHLLIVSRRLRFDTTYLYLLAGLTNGQNHRGSFFFLPQMLKKTL